MATAHELDDLNNVDLESKLREAKEELFNLRFQAATGQLESHGRLRAVKKDIARIYTVVRERELGIRTAPGADEGERMSENTTQVRPNRRAAHGPQGPRGPGRQRQDGQDRGRLRRGPRQARALRQGHASYDAS